MLFQLDFSTYYDIKMGLRENKKGIPLILHFLKEIKKYPLPMFDPEKIKLSRIGPTPLHLYYLKNNTLLSIFFK